MNCYGYRRCSTAGQALEGDTLEAQERRIRGYCDQEGLSLVRMFTDAGVSGGKRLRDRPEGGALLSVARRGDVIVASKLDRAFRDSLDAHATLKELISHRIRLVLLDIGDVTSDKGVGALLFGVLASVSQWERSRVAERTVEAKQVQRSAGRFLGGKPPVGYRVGEDGRLEPIAEEQGAIALVLKLGAEGESLRRIKGTVYGTFGIRWSHVAVARILRDAKIVRAKVALAAR